ncbi:TF28 protein, partial [Erithacus rubecula]|nr:TF28 protein [Erithacus rubecula]
IHELTYWGTQAICDHFLREYTCVGVHSLAKTITDGCLICQKANQKQMRKPASGGRELALRPFQNIQVDFTEMPSVQEYKYLLVIVDHLTHWVEAFPTKRETADVATKILLEQTVPRYGIINNIDSDRGSHFTTKVLQDLVKALGIRWLLHTPWHPQSSGRVERMNKSLKNILTKLIMETGLNWLKCLPLALLRIRTNTRSDIGASPYEMMFGLPFLLSPYSTGEYLEGEAAAQKYLETIGKTLEELRRKGYLPQSSPLHANIHKITPGDWVLMKTWNN